ncbi:flagellar basal body rod modification protein [Bacillus cereus]|nr:flagellar basal body rod modification protein [Bacillus cereus]PGU70454.1 flagellar basal body rod modification protein [Bacillus cereus]
MPTVGLNTTSANHIPSQTQAQNSKAATSLSGEQTRAQKSDGTKSASSQMMSGLLGKEDFLKLFLASLKYQDPSNPMDMNQMMNQTAQFSIIEQVDNMTKAVDALRQTVSTNPLDGGMKFLGKYIKGVDSEGKLVTGKVDVVRLAGNNEVQLVVGDHIVSLYYVVNVSDEPIKDETDPDKPDITNPETPDETNPEDDKTKSVTTTNK